MPVNSDPCGVRGVRVRAVTGPNGGFEIGVETERVGRMKIFGDLYQFSAYDPRYDLSYHQYLLLTDEPLLVHTGNALHAEGLIPQLKSALGDRALKYVFLSHFESDECGGLPLILKHYPGARPVCSEVSSRELRGFGITEDFIVKKPGEKLAAGGFELEFVGFPSEVHLWEGLIAYEARRGILFCSDLIFRFGRAHGAMVDADWREVVDRIDRVPNPAKLEQLQAHLRQLRPRFVATGHGPCLSIAG